MAVFVPRIRRGVAHIAWQLHPATPAAAYSMLRATQWWDPDALLELQLRALRGVLDSAARIPAYRQRLDEAGLAPREVRSLEAFARIAPLGRDEVIRLRLGPAAMRRNRSPTIRQSSSGSTGRPVEVRWPPGMLRWVLAIERRARDWLGVELGQRGLVVRAGRTGTLYRFSSGLRNVRLLPAAQLADGDYTKRAIREISSDQPQWIAGLGNGIYVLAQQLLDAGRPLAVRACQAGGNHLPDLYRETIEAACGCRVSQHYATVETGLIAHECSAGTLHLAPELTLVEILRDDGSAAAAGEVGRVVVTSLRNREMPLIRYRTGDLAAVSPSTCACRRALPALTQLVGRSNELVRRIDGRTLPPEAISKVMTQARASVLEYQIIQRADRSLDVAVVQRDEDHELYRRRIAADLDRLLGATGLTRLERVERIPITAGESSVTSSPRAPARKPRPLRARPARPDRPAGCRRLIRCCPRHDS